MRLDLSLDLGHARKLGPDDALVRAIGKEARTVVDCTGGLGRDAASLARIRYSVIAIERVPALVALWHEALAEAPSSLSFLAGDAIEHLASFRACGFRPDVALVDPMYPEPDGGRTAAPEKALVQLRELAGDDADAPALLDAALLTCARVIVKRPKRAPLMREGVAHSWTGASTRFDLYRAP